MADNMAFTIERAKYKALCKLKEKARTAGDTTRFYELVRECRKSHDKMQELLSRR